VGVNLCPVQDLVWRTSGPRPSSSAAAAEAPVTTSQTSSPSGWPPSTTTRSSQGYFISTVKNPSNKRSE